MHVQGEPPAAARGAAVGGQGRVRRRRRRRLRRGWRGRARARTPSRRCVPRSPTCCCSTSRCRACRASTSCARSATSCDATRTIILVRRTGQIAAADGDPARRSRSGAERLATELLFEAMTRVMAGHSWVGQTLVADLMDVVRRLPHQPPARRASSHSASPRASAKCSRSSSPAAPTRKSRSASR